jgi:hypothetical protein
MEPATGVLSLGIAVASAETLAVVYPYKSDIGNRQGIVIADTIGISENGESCSLPLSTKSRINIGCVAP